jgi:hypothetical protein
MRQFTVSETLAEWESDPDAAVTVIVEVTGWIGTPTCEDPDPPHPETRLKPTTAAARPRSIGKRRFLQPKQQIARASEEPEKNGLKRRSRAALAAEVATVTVVEAAAPDGVTVAGAKLQDAPDGSPEHVNVTAALKPFTGVTVSVAVPLCPAATVNAAGDAAIEKSGGRV